MANPNENRINTTIAPADVLTIDGGFTTVGITLDPYTQPLTEEERDKLFSIAEENNSFANDALAQGQLLSAQFPPVLQTVVTNLLTDTKLELQLEKIEETQVLPLLQRIKDTRRLANHERFVAALTIYKMIETGAAMALPGFQAAYDILKVRFAGQGGNAPQPNP